MELLSLTTDELRGKRILDIGIGGGVAVRQAIDAGLDVTGFDILPVYTKKDIAKIAQYDIRDARHVIERVAMLREFGKNYPGRVIAGDGTRVLPFATNSFDMVTSCMALPGYAQNTQEAKTAITEMIRVAKEKVVFTTWSQGSDGLFRYGIDGQYFNFDLYGYLNNLKKQRRISYVNKTSTIGEVSVHITC